MFRKVMRQVKNRMKEYNDVERRVREATSNDPWPSTSTVMHQIANDANDHFRYDSLLGMLLKRLQDYGQILHVKKALFLAEFLLRNAPQRFVNDMKDRSHIFNHLTKYRYLVDGADKGEDVRAKASSILRLIKDDNLLEKQRETAIRTRGRFVGYANDAPLQITDREDPFGRPTGGGRVSLPAPEDDSEEQDDRARRRRGSEAAEGSEVSSNMSSDDDDHSALDTAQELSPSRKRAHKTKKNKKNKKTKKSKSKRSEHDESTRGSIFDIDMMTGDRAPAKVADNWLADVARLDRELDNSPAPVHPPTSLFDQLPTTSEEDPFGPAPVQFQQSNNEFTGFNTQSQSTFSVAPAFATAPAEAFISQAAPVDPVWSSHLTDVTTLVHPHDYHGHQIQKERESRLPKNTGGVSMIEMARASGGARPQTSSSFPVLGDGKISHKNPFEATLLPSSLQAQYEQRQMLAIMPPENAAYSVASNQQALVPAGYYNHQPQLGGSAPLALPMPGPSPYPMPQQLTYHAPAW
jgi:hypothetical protein